MVPLVATDKVKLSNAFPFIIGANVGTTITALLAALFKSETAVSIAIAHLLFNCIGACYLPAISDVKKTAGQGRRILRFDGGPLQVGKPAVYHYYFLFAALCVYLLIKAITRQIVIDVLKK